MEIKEFIASIASQFDDTDISEFKAETNFRDLEEWSSLTALAILNMMEKKCHIVIKAEEMSKTKSIQELFNLMQSKMQ